MRLYDGGNTNPDSKISKALNFDMESFQFYGSYNFGDVYIFMGKTVVFFFSKFHFFFHMRYCLLVYSSKYRV